MRKLEEQRDEIAHSLAAAAKRVNEKVAAVEKIRVDMDKVDRKL